MIGRLDYHAPSCPGADSLKLCKLPATRLMEISDPGMSKRARVSVVNGSTTTELSWLSIVAAFNNQPWFDRRCD